MTTNLQIDKNAQDNDKSGYEYLQENINRTSEPIIQLFDITVNPAASPSDEPTSIPFALDLPDESGV